jgi:antitoxin PrlF
MNIATVNSKGQVTVPIEIRNRLGLKAGDRLAFIDEGGEIILRLDRDQKNPFAGYAGALRPMTGCTEAINAWVANLRGDARRESGS